MAFLEKFHLLAVVFAFEAGLRALSYVTRDESGKSKYPLLSPIYFCSIPPFFYVCDFVLGMTTGTNLGDDFFFPSLTYSIDGGSSLWGQDDIWEIFQIIEMRNISWAAVLRSIPTMIALVLFSLIHVPINIPAFAVSSNVDVDMNAELVAHGYSNGIAGLLGGTSDACLAQITS
jgi:SulP family sulfate permease